MDHDKRFPLVPPDICTARINTIWICATFSMFYAHSLTHTHERAKRRRRRSLKKIHNSLPAGCVCMIQDGCDLIISSSRALNGKFI